MIRVIWRAHRTGLLVTAAFGVFYLLVNTAGYTAAAGDTEAARQSFAHSMSLVAVQLSYLLPLPVRLDTVGGYVMWRGYPFFSIVLLVWTLIAACGIARGEEERGLVELYLAAGVGRVRWLLWRGGGFAVALAIPVLLTSVATWAGIRAAGFTVDGSAVALEGVATWALGLALFGLFLLVAEVVAPRGTALGVSAALGILLFFLDSLARTDAGLRRIAWLSPFHLFNASRGLAPGGRFDAGATFALLGIGVVALALAIAVFERRELGAGLLVLRSRRHPAQRRAPGSALLRVPVLAALREERWTLGFWAVGGFLLAIVMVQSAHSMTDLLTSNPALRSWLVAGVSPFRSVLSVVWFSTVAFAVALFAVLQTAGWAGQDQSGRLEMELAEPVARWRVIVERAFQLALGCLLLVVAGTLGLLVGSARFDASLGDRLWLATVLLLPVGLSFGGAGAALAAWRPRLATGVLAALAVLCYLVQVLGPVFKAPQWVVNLSIFQLYGTPLTSDLNGGGLVAMLTITGVGFGLAVIALNRREVGR